MTSVRLEKGTDYSSEVELLLTCCRTKIDVDQQERILSLLQSSIDWHSLVRFANVHGVQTLLYQSVKSVGENQIPVAVLRDLTVYAQQIAIFNTILTRDLLKILDLLHTYDIRALPFKGPVLAASVYGSISLRHFCDLDILVSPLDFAKTIEVLVAEGYQLAYEWNLLDQDLELTLRNSKSEYQLIKDAVSIDLHQTLTVERFLSSQFTFDYLWGNREPVLLSGHTFYSFGSDDLLMYLCIHGSKDCWRKLKWICDLSECIQQTPGRDWQHFLQRAAQMRCERMVLLGLCLAHQVLETELPDVVQAKIDAHPGCSRLAQDFGQRLFDQENELGRSFTPQKFIRHWQMTETRRDRIACILDIRRPIQEVWLKCLPNVNDHDFLVLPKPLYFLYFLIRPLRLGLKRLNSANPQKS